MFINFVRGLVTVGVSALLCTAAIAQYPQYQPYQQYQPYPVQQPYPAAAAPTPDYQLGHIQTYTNNPAPSKPASWSYSPYTSGLGPCPQRDRGDAACSDRIAPTAGQPNYWSLCSASSGMSDAQCHQAAMAQAFQSVYAQRAAVEPQIAQQAAMQSGPLTLPASAYEPVSVDYTTPSDNRRRRVTVKRLSSYSEPASRQVCDTFTRIDADLDGGTTTTASARRCKGANGQWHEA